MKRWALVVAVLYCLMLGVLAPPAMWLAFVPKVDWHWAMGLYGRSQLWLFLGVMGLAQVALLAVPVELARGRPVARRPLALTVLTATLMMSGLMVGAFCAIYEFALHEHGGSWVTWTGIAVAVAGWGVWGVIFYRMSRVTEPEDMVSRLCKYMLKGSILELLIAVPTHIVARCRDYCCAGVMTFVGLTLGVGVMLFSFGPGVFFLFAARWRRVTKGREGAE